MSYTDPVVTYLGDGVEDTYTVPFDFLLPTDLVAYVDGEVATFTTPTDTTITLDNVPNNGETIVIRRSTDIDEAVSVFTDPGALLAENLNDALDQLRFSLQEAHVRIDAGLEGGGDGGGENPMPVATAADRFLVSVVDGAGFDWEQKTVTQVNTLLGTPSVPTPVSGSKFLVTDDSTNVYELATASEVRTILGITTLTLPDPTSNPSQFLVSNSSGSGYQLITPAAVRSALSLGTAATKNTGTSVGNVVELISHSSGAALPAVRGDNLLGVAKALDYAFWTRDAGAAGSEFIAASWADVSSHTSLTKAISELGSSAWSRKTGSDVLQVDAGTYYIKAIISWHPYGPGGTIDAAAYGAAARVHLTGTTNTNDFEGPIGTTYHTTSGTPYKLGETVVEGVFKVTSGSTTDIQIQAQRYAGADYETGSETHTLGPASNVCVRIHLWKLA